LIGVAEGLLPTFVAVLPIVKAVLHFLTTVPDEAAAYLSARYAGLMIDLFHGCEEARPSNGAEMGLLTTLFRFHLKLCAAAPEQFGQHLSARFGRLPHGHDFVCQYGELLETGKAVRDEVLRSFFQALYDAADGDV
jgi:hypothetical protein